MRSLYIHTPFCVHKCHYCDFYSFVDSRDQQAAFVDRLSDELRALAPLTRDATGAPAPLKSIFVGGGTPSLLRIELWQRLLAVLSQEFDLRDIRDPSRGEFTVECNPESATRDLMDMLHTGGVNRVSVGCQSFNPLHLKTLERWHDPDNVARALDHARAAGIRRQSIDLIYAIPGQTLADWRDDLTRALALRTTHLSCYNLTYEPNTPMTARLNDGAFTPTDEDVEADMFTLTGEMLAAAGLRRYEVSNYAHPGAECRHNLAYWRQEQWLAAGPSASGHLWADADPLRGGHRWKNRPTLAHYLDVNDAGFAPVTSYEPPDPARAVRERLMTGARLAEGIDWFAALRDAQRVSPGSAERLTAAAAELAGDGFIEHADHRLRLTDRGWLYADFVARRLMTCLPDNE